MQKMSNCIQRSVTKLRFVVFIVFAELLLVPYVRNDDNELKFFNDLAAGCLDAVIKDSEYNNVNYCSVVPDYKETNYCTMKNIKCNNEDKVLYMVFSGLALPKIPDSILNLVELKFLTVNHCVIIDGIDWKVINKLTNLSILSLPNNSIQGKIPDLSLVNLDKLCLADNNIDDISGLKNLNNLTYLDLSGNTIKGNISILSRLEGIKYLDLSHNEFSGDISALEPMLNLTHLDLSCNNLDGDISLLKKFIHLIYIDLSGNKFSGNISSLMKQEALVYLNLSCNSFSGSLLSLSNISTIRNLDISVNKFSGDLEPVIDGLYRNSTERYCAEGNNPIENFKMKSLERLNISHNEFSCNIIQLNKRSKIKKLDTSYNKFTSIHSSFENLPELEYVDLSSNLMSGDVPMFYKKSLVLKHINLSHNNFSDDYNTSHYPKSVIYLDVSFNNFGFSTLWIRNIRHLPDMPNLEYLDSSSNPDRPYVYGHAKLKYINLSNVNPKGWCNTPPFNKLNLGDYESLVTLNMSYSSFCFNLKTLFRDRVPAKVEHINISHTRINGDIGYLAVYCKNSKKLDLSYTNITGDINQFNESNYKLEYLNVSHSQVFGEILSSFGELCNLEYFDGSSASLSGSVRVFSYMHQLKYLNLSNNGFVGDILSLKLMKNLESLDLSGNNMRVVCDNLIFKNTQLKVDKCNLGEVSPIIVACHGTASEFCRYTI